MARIEEGKIIFESGSEYELITRGRAQAEQVIRLSSWLSKYGSKMFAELQDMNSGGVRESNIIELITALMGVLDVNALLEAFELVTSCKKKEADAEFDIAVLLDAGLEIINGNESFRKIIERFFSESES